MSFVNSQSKFHSGICDEIYSGNSPIDVFPSKIHIDCYSSKTNHSSYTEIILQYYRPEDSSVGRVIYARYSSDNQREESIEGQIRENTEFARKNGIEIVETYIDGACSAKTDNRPEFQRMISDSFSRNFEIVIVCKLDRFARSRFDSAKYRVRIR